MSQKRYHGDVRCFFAVAFRLAWGRLVWVVLGGAGAAVLDEGSVR